MRTVAGAVAFHKLPIARASKLEICQAALEHCDTGTYAQFAAWLREGILLTVDHATLDTVQDPAQ